MDAFYRQNCGCSHHHSILELTGDDWLETLALQLYKDKINNGKIDASLYTKTANNLINGLSDAIGGLSFGYGDNRADLAAYMRHNIFSFSAAKSLTELQTINSLLIDPETGKAKQWAQFKEDVTNAGIRFNEIYLKAEHNNVLNNAYSALEWENLKDQEYLEFRTAEDDEVRPTHAALDKLTVRRDSPVLETYSTPLDWRCRCHWIPGIAANVKLSDNEFGKLIKNAVTNPVFKNNPGISKTIFKDDHPYFTQAKKSGVVDQLFQAEKHYGLPGKDKIYTRTDLPTYKPMSSKEEYYSFWDKLPKLKGTDDVVIQDKLGQNILFDSGNTSKNKRKAAYFRDHIIQKENEKRFEYGYLFPDVLKNPDEMWSQIQNGRLITYYLKFYENNPIVVVSDELKASSIYTADKIPTLLKIRQGALLYKK